MKTFRYSTPVVMDNDLARETVIRVTVHVHFMPKLFKTFPPRRNNVGDNRILFSTLFIRGSKNSSLATIGYCLRSLIRDN